MKIKIGGISGAIIAALIILGIPAVLFMFWWPLIAYSFNYWFGG